MTFHSVDRHTVDFKLAVDGSIESDPITPNLNSTQQVSSDAYFAVYDASAGADENDRACPWFSCSTITPPTAAPLASDRCDIVNFDNHATMVDEVLNHVLTASVDVGAGAHSLMVFGNLTLIANRNTNPGTTTLDFLNTAAFGFDLDPGVTFDSPYGSQSFLQNSVNVGIRSPVPSQVPEPATGWLLIGGLGGLALHELRRSGPAHLDSGRRSGCDGRPTGRRQPLRSFPEGSQDVVQGIPVAVQIEHRAQAVDAGCRCVLHPAGLPRSTRATSPSRPPRARRPPQAVRPHPRHARFAM